MPPTDTDATGPGSSGRYVLESQLGFGGMGVVHVALDTHLQRRVALKVVSTQLAGSAEFRERFQREAATLARLDSPHIIAIYDHGEQDGLPYLATQLVRGGDLGDLIATRGPLAPPAAVRVGSQLADALSDAHRAGIIHRDIKPTNVLVRDPDAPRLHVYLCDFGIAVDESSDRMTTAGSIVGTWAYLAPERSQGEAATPASDIYALGCLLWVCLVGQAPYAGTDLRVVMAHVNAPVRQLIGDDPYVRHLNEVLARTMAKDPAHRYPDAAAVREALDAVPSAWGAPTVLTPVPIPDQGRPSTPTQVSGASLRPTSPPPPPPPAAASLAPTRPPPARPPAGPPARTPVLPGPPAYVAPPAPGGGSRRGVLVALAAVVVVVLVAGLVFGLTRGGEDPGRAEGGTADPISGTSDPTTDPRTTTEPTVGPTVAPDPEPLVDASVVNDLDGDGLGDMVGILQSGADLSQVATYTMTSTGRDFTATTERVADYLTYGDLDGDETADSFAVTVPRRGPVRLTSSVPGLDGRVLRDIDAVRDFNYLEVMVGDVDGDGQQDLVLWGQSDERTVTVWALLGEDGGLADPAPWLVLEQSHVYTMSMTLADFDNDGSADLLAVLPTGQIDFQGIDTFYDGPRGTRLYASDGIGFSASGPLTEDSVLETGVLPVVGDYTGDGTPLLALGDPSGLGVSIYEVTADGITAQPELHVDLAKTSYVATAKYAPSDVDGDGDDDLVLTRKISETTYRDVQVAIAEGDSFSAPTTWGPALTCDGSDLCFFDFYAAY